MGLLNMLFAPVLWAIPVFMLICINIYQIAKHGLVWGKLPFYKRFSSINVIMFCVLWLIFVFHTPKPLSNMVTIYLGFVLLFACYGTGELFYRVLWTKRKLATDTTPTMWFPSFMYPIFFAFNNVPLYIFFPEKFAVNFNLFIMILLVALSIYIPFYFFEGKWIAYKTIKTPLNRPPPRPYNTAYYVGYYLYVLARFTLIVAYAVLLWL